MEQQQHQSGSAKGELFLVDDRGEREQLSIRLFQRTVTALRAETRAPTSAGDAEMRRAVCIVAELTSGVAARGEGE